MIAPAAAFLGGILIALAAPMPWQQGALAVVGTVALLAVLSRRWALAVALPAGFLLAQHAALRVLDAAFDCGERRLVVARVESLPVSQDAGWQYDAIVRPAAAPLRPALRVRVSHSVPVPPRSGEQWQLLLQFDMPAAGAAAGARRRALLRDHVTTTARVRPSPLNRRLAAAPPSIDLLRARVAGHIQSRVADPSAAGLLAALAVGVTGDVSDLQWRVFSATGITHLVAISGMHVTFFALLCMGLARVAWRRCRWLGACCRRESFAALVGVALAFAYALLSGFSVPAQRTAVMLAVFLAARCAGRNVVPTWSVAAALVAVLAFDPLAVLSAGFWLSFGAVAAIILVAGGRLHPPGSLRAAALVQWVVTVALLPVTAALFGSFAAVGPLVNAAAIPLFTFALVPPVLLATALYLLPPGPAHACADYLVDLAAWVAQQSWPWLVRAAELPWATWNIDAGAPWLLLSLPAVLGVLGPFPLPLRLGSLALLCSGFATSAAAPRRGTVEVVAFDVGAARAVLLRTAGHQLLVGTGEGFGTAGRRFERVVLPELLRAGGPVDVVLDRADRDSLQALAMARARLALGAAWAPPGAVAPELRACRDAEWRWDEVQFALRGTPQGCWVTARAGATRVLVSPARIAGEAPPDLGAATLVVLPRSARDAARLSGAFGSGALQWASVSGAEWRSAGWQALRARRDGQGPALWTTASQGDLKLTLRADGALVRVAPSGWQAGVWADAGIAAPGGQREHCGRSSASFGL